jgi:uncharacterized protein YdeI (YjbR/CyaY-like superfamily)
LKYAALRDFALSLPEVTEQPHFDSGSFRVRGRIFVTVPPDQGHVHVFLPEEAREEGLALYPDVAEKLTSGRKVVGLRLALAPAPAAAAKRLVRQAWESRAPKALLAAAAACPVPRPRQQPSFFANAAGFRSWLAEHGATASELVVGFHKRGSGRQSMTWSEAVDEALCFGWIDGVRTRIDEHAYRIRFSRRRPGSVWSAINIDKALALQAAGRMMPDGLEAFARRNEEKSRIYSYEQVKRAEFEPAQMAEFRKHRKAWQFFEAQPPGYRHLAAWFVVSAKRPQTRQARLAKLIDASARGQRI